MSEPTQSPRRLRAFTRLLPQLKRHKALIAGWLCALAVSSTATLTLPQAVPAGRVDLAFRLDGTPRNAACPCGSGKKFKHCHGRI